MTKQIPLTQGKFALVDDADYEWLSQYRWHAKYNGRQWYACREIGPRINRTRIKMHRSILNAPDDKFVDHINNQTLDNRRVNLRLCDKSENGRNRSAQRNNTSGFKGVHWNREKRRWMAFIHLNRKFRHLGYYDTPEEAARAYDDAARELHGHFAYLNFQDRK